MGTAEHCWDGACALQELVQVESLAQVGVQLLLFTLGLEFSLSKLRAVRSVALLGAPLTAPQSSWTCSVRMHLSLTLSGSSG